MASVASQKIEEVTAHAQSDSLEDAREICADGTYFPNKPRTYKVKLNKLTKMLNLSTVAAVGNSNTGLLLLISVTDIIKSATLSKLGSLACKTNIFRYHLVNRLMPNDPYIGRTAPLTYERCILYIYSTNVGTEYFKHALYSPVFSLQNLVCFIMLTCLVSVLFTFYIQDVLKLKKK